MKSGLTVGWDIKGEGGGRERRVVDGEWIIGSERVG